MNAEMTSVKQSIAEIQSRIVTVRGVQVMLDRDLAAFYGVEPRALNQAVKRNLSRFPERFMHQLTKEEYDNLKSQSVISSWGGDRYLPKVFTEQGVSMLSAVLHSSTAIEVSIRIMDAFVAMRHMLISMAPVISRVETVERRLIGLEDAQMQTSGNVAMILDAMRDKRFPDQKVFYDGQVYDAKAFATKYILSARKTILLIDNWVDVVTLDMLAKKKRGVKVEIVTSPKGNHLAATDIASFNAQYGGLTVRASTNFHDRFVIIDDKALYLFGASLKDLGKKCFAFTRLDASEIAGLKARVK